MTIRTITANWINNSQSIRKLLLGSQPMTWKSYLSMFIKTGRTLNGFIQPNINKWLQAIQAPLFFTHISLKTLTILVSGLCVRSSKLKLSSLPTHKNAMPFLRQSEIKSGTLRTALSPIHRLMRLFLLLERSPQRPWLYRSWPLITPPYLMCNTIPRSRYQSTLNSRRRESTMKMHIIRNSAIRNSHSWNLICNLRQLMSK